MKKLHFVGLGNAGAISLLYFYNNHKLASAEYAYINSYIVNEQAQVDFYQIEAPKKDRYSILIPEKEFYKRIKIPEKVYELFQKDRKYVLLAGYAGRTGSYLALTFSKFLKDKNIDFINIGSLPFYFEGEKREQRARKTVEQLAELGEIHYVELQKATKKYGNLSVKAAFDKISEEMYNLYESTL